MAKALIAIFMFASFMTLMTSISIVSNAYKNKADQQVETVALRDINFLLSKEGYKIYFRITEEGQLSLVHPR